MNSLNRRIVAGLVLAVSVFGPGPADGAGTIIVQDAILLDGQAPARGGVTLAPNAVIGTVPNLFPPAGLVGNGTISSVFPGVPVDTSGAVAGYSASSDETVPGGRFIYTSYSISAGATVTYTAGTAINVDGDVDIAGMIRTTADNANVSINATGTIRIHSLSGSPVTGVSTSGAAAPVRIAARQGIQIGVGADDSPDDPPLPGTAPVLLQSTMSTVVLLADGAPSDGEPGISIVGTDVVAGAPQLTISVDSTSGLRCAASTFRGMGRMEFTSRDGDLEVLATTIEATASDGGSADVTLRSAQSIHVLDGSHLISRGGTLSLIAHGTDVEARGLTLLEAYDADAAGLAGRIPGQVLVDAARDVSIAESSGIRVTATGVSGRITVLGRNGDVAIEKPDGAGRSFIDGVGTSDIEGFGSPFINVSAGNDLFFGGLSSIAGEKWGVFLTAISGDLVQEGGAYVNTTGALLQRAGNGIVSDSTLQIVPGVDPFVKASQAEFRAGSGGITLDVDRIHATASFARFLSTGPISLRGTVHGETGVTVTSLASAVQVADTVMTTGDAGGQSGDILIETFDPVATIDASRADLRTADHTTESGGVELAVRATSVEAVDAFLVPRTATVRLNSNSPTRSILRVTGVLDAGSATFDSTRTSMGAIHIQGRTYGGPIGSKAPTILAGTDEVSMQIKLPKLGGSQARFTLVARAAALNELVSLNGPLTLRFSDGAIDASCTFDLTRGKFKSKNGGIGLSGPVLFVRSAKAKHTTVGKDRLDLDLSFEPLPTPEVPPLVSVQWGDEVTFAVPGSEFTSTGDKLSVKAPPSAPTLKSLKIDLARGTLKLKAAQLDLGVRPDAAAPVQLQVKIGDVVRSVTVRLGPKLKTLRVY